LTGGHLDARMSALGHAPLPDFRYVLRIEDGRRPLVAAGDLRAIDAMIDLREHNNFLVSAVRHEMLKSAHQREL
jgi:hypothetical protein